MPGRRIVIVRHGERVDFTFSEEWITTCFSEGSYTYTKNNLNMPDTVPKRDNPRLFLRDCPLTQVGEVQGLLTGKGLKSENVLRDGFEIFVSPALRSVQTAAAIGKGMNVDFNLKIEPALFEYLGWFKDIMPVWMTPQQYGENGFKIDESYVPFMSVDSLNRNEDIEEAYNRSFRFVQHVLQNTDKDILIVAHGCSLDTCSRQLMGREPVQSYDKMMTILRGVPYCGTAFMEFNDSSQTWELVSIPRMSMKHTSVNDFDASLSTGPDFDPSTNLPETPYHS